MNAKCCRIIQLKQKTLLTLRGRVDWSRSLLFIYDTKEIFFSRCGSNGLCNKRKTFLCQLQIMKIQTNFCMSVFLSLRKHAYSNIKKISPPKTENFQVKNSDIFHISAQNIDCGYSLEHICASWSEHLLVSWQNAEFLSPQFTVYLRPHLLTILVLIGKRLCF